MGPKLMRKQRQPCGSRHCHDVKPAQGCRLQQTPQERDGHGRSRQPEGTPKGAQEGRTGRQSAQPRPVFRATRERMQELPRRQGGEGDGRAACPNTVPGRGCRVRGYGDGRQRRRVSRDRAQTTLESMDAAGSRGGSVITVGSVGSTAKARAGKTSDKRLIQPEELNRPERPRNPPSESAERH